jgi:hypothetical protein
LNDSLTGNFSGINEDSAVLLLHRFNPLLLAIPARFHMLVEPFELVFLLSDLLFLLLFDLQELHEQLRSSLDRVDHQMLHEVQQP